MKKIRKSVALVLKYGTLLSTIGFVVATLVQIYARFFMESAPSWTEEAARFFFVFAVSFASGLAMKDGSYVHFDVFYNKINKKYQGAIRTVISILSFALFLIVTIYAFQFVRMGVSENSPSLSISMGIAFVSIAFMGLSISFFAFLDVLKNLKK